jgi:DNA mismatch repair protein MutL
MHKISILTESLINKIAAGEVIERPASIVRELIDNSIDAEAKTVSVEILYGGKKLIKVADDGAGMEREDAELCFERHATSKITSEDDLFNIHTLGFRGEALSSIASVAKVTLLTSAANASVGTNIELSAGQKKQISDAPPLKGTTLEIRDIFYNTPARKKFLKSTTTETSHIIDTVTQKALSYPDITFTLRHNNAEILNVSSAKDIKERFTQIYGEELLNEFLTVGKEGNGIRLYGFLSSADFARSTRNYQLIFVNRRPVKNPTINHAVYNV